MPASQPIVILVEADPGPRTVLGDALRRAGYMILRAPTGVEALRILDRYPDVDLVVTDVEAPARGGFDLTRAMANDERFQDVPVVVCGGTMGPQAITAALGLSMELAIDEIEA